jgi:hypothetical protein
MHPRLLARDFIRREDLFRRCRGPEERHRACAHELREVKRQRIVRHHDMCRAEYRRELGERGPTDQIRNCKAGERRAQRLFLLRPDQDDLTVPAEQIPRELHIAVERPAPERVVAYHIAGTARRQHDNGRSASPLQRRRG